MPEGKCLSIHKNIGDKKTAGDEKALVALEAAHSPQCSSLTLVMSVPTSQEPAVGPWLPCLPTWKPAIEA